MKKLTTYTNREIIRGEYPTVSYKTKQYDLLSMYHKISISEKDAKTILKWLSNSYKMKLKINFRNCYRSWGGVRKGQPFVTIARRDKFKITTVGIVIHEFAHAYNYNFGLGRNHDDSFIIILDKFIKKYHTTKAKPILEIKKKENNS